MEYTILDKKSNSYCSYIRYDNGRVTESGAKLYTQLLSSEERDAWIKAMDKYNKDHGIKDRSQAIKDKLDELKISFDSDDKKFPDRKSLIMPDFASLVVPIGSDDFIENMMIPGGVSIPSPIAALQYAWSSTKFNINRDLDIAMHSFAKVGVSAAFNGFIDLTKTTVDTYFTKTALIEDEVRKKANKVFRTYESITNTPEGDEKDRLKNKIKEDTEDLEKKHGKWITETIYTILCIDKIKSVSDLLSNFQNTAKSVWKTTLNAIQELLYTDLSDYQSANIKALKKAMSDILAALALLAGSFISQKCAEEQEADADNQLTADILNTDTDHIDEVSQRNARAYQDKISSSFYIYNKAMSNEGGYSMSPYNQQSNGSSHGNTTQDNDQTNDSSAELQKLCKVSMCDEIEDTNDEDIDRALGNGTVGAILEFDRKSTVNMLIGSGDNIYSSDNIVTMDGVNVFSELNLENTRIEDHVVVGKYSQTNENDMMSSLESAIGAGNTEVYSNIMADFENLYKVDKFIREYISYFRFPELAQYTREHTEANAVEISSEDFINEYEAYADEYYNRYIDNIRSINDPDNLRPLLEAGHLTEIKKKNDDAKREYYNNIFNLYNRNPGEIKYCSKGRIRDYMLYDRYSQYIFGDRFEYDEDNPYIVKLYNTISSFIGIRRRLETNSDNISDLIKMFDELCNDVIRRYWPKHADSYYKELSKLFTYEYYEDVSSIIGKEDGVDGISIYKRVLKYLKSICKFSMKDETEINVGEGSDINKIIQEQGKKSADSTFDKDAILFERKLKQIAYRFVSIRKIEQSMTSFNIDDYDKENVVSKFSDTAAYTMGLVLDYKEGDTYTAYYTQSQEDIAAQIPPIPNPLFGSEEIAGSYMQILKKVTAEEAKQLKEIVHEAVDWYESNAESIENCSAFSQFMQIQWPTPGRIYIGNDAYDYYMFSHADQPSNNAQNVFSGLEEEENKADSPTEDQEMEAYPDTQARSNELRYWLKYCAMASLTNLMLPMYWSTGLIIAGSPIKLPIIYIPIVFIQGRVSVLIGIGICGIAIYPMFVFVNVGNINGSLLVPINMLIDMTIKKLKDLATKKRENMGGMLKPMIKTLDKEINQLNSELSDLDYQIETIKGVPLDKKEIRKFKNNKKKKQAN